MKTKTFTFFRNLRFLGLAAFFLLLLGQVKAQGTNLLTNPGFEEASGGYSLWERSAIQSDVVHSGTKAAVVWNLGAPDPGYTGGGLGFEYLAPTIGKSYTLKAYGKLKNDIGNGANIFIQFKDAGGSNIGIEQAPTFSGMEWSMQSVSAIIPVNTVKITCGIWFDGPGSDSLYMDDFILTLDPENLLTNSGFEEASGGYSLWERSAVQADEVHFGSKAAAVWNLGAPDPGYTGGGLGFEYSAPVIGASYTLEAYGKLKNDIGNDANIFIQFKDAGGSNIGIQQAPTFAGKDWTMQSVTAEIPANTAKLVCGIWFDGPGSDTLYMDDFLLYLSAMPANEPGGTGKTYAPSYVNVTGGGAMPDIANGYTCDCDGTGATDATACLQAALDEAKNQGKPLLIPATEGYYKISSKLLVDCSVIGVGGMPTIKQTSELSEALLILDDMTGWIYNLHIVGPYDGSPKPPVTNDFGHNIAVRGVNGLTISNNILETPIGDNIGDEGGQQKPLRNMLITNNTLLNPWRCNISATAVVDRVAIMNNVLTYYSQYVDPIDIEPYQDASFTTNIEVGYNDIQSPKPVLTGDGSHYYEAILQITAWWDETPGGNIFSHHNWGDWGAPFTQITGYQGGPSTWVNILSLNNVEGTEVPGEDVQAPAVVTGFAATDVTKTLIPLTWTAGSDNVGVTGYIVYLDGNIVGLTNSPSYDAAGLTCGTAYSVKVKAYDDAGNTSSASNAYNVSTLDCAGGTNLLLNPGFEQPLSVGWTDDWGGNAVDETTVRSGMYSLNLGPNDGGRAQPITEFIPGGTYILSAWGRFTGTGDFYKQSTYIGTQFKDSEGTTIDTQTAVITDSVDWQKVSISFTIPENAASVIVFQYYEARGISTNNALTDDWSLIIFTPAASVSVNPATISVPVGIVKKAKAVFEPIDATNQTVSWSSSDTLIAKVDATGLVQGMAEGMATISAKSEDGGFIGTSEVTVTPPTANLLKNAGIEQSLSTGWTGDWGNNSVNSAEFHSGAKSLAIGPNDGGRAQPWTGFVPGSTYTLSAFGKLIGTGGFASQASYIGADIRDASNVRIALPTAPILDSLDWVQTSVTFTLPMEASSISVYVYLEARGITGNYSLTDDWAVISGWKALPYVPVSVASSNTSGNLKLYPNPVVGQLLNIEGAEDSQSISIFDMTGRMVFSKELQGFEKQTVNLNNKVQKGSYIVKISGKSGNNSQLLLVE